MNKQDLPLNNLQEFAIYIYFERMYVNNRNCDS